MTHGEIIERAALAAGRSAALGERLAAMVEEAKPTTPDAATFGGWGSGHGGGAPDIKAKAAHDTLSAQHGAMQTHHAAEAHKAASAGNKPLAKAHSAAASAHAGAKAAHDLARSKPVGDKAHAKADEMTDAAYGASKECALCVGPTKTSANGSPLRFSVALSATATEAPEYVVKDGVRYVVGKPQQIFPGGFSQAVDGRAVVLDDRNGPLLVADFDRREVDLPITYDHEEDVARGSEAAGWAGGLEWRGVDGGLWATSVLWTVDAYSEMCAGKWRYVSGDAFALEYESGKPFTHNSTEAAYPVRMMAFTLCPKPALQNGLGALTLATLDQVTPKAPAPVTKRARKDKHMEPETLAALGLKPDAGPVEIHNAVMALKTPPAPPEAPAAPDHEEPDGDEGCDHCEECSGEGGCTNHEGVPDAAQMSANKGAKKMPNPVGLMTSAIAAAEKRIEAKFAADLAAAETKLKADAEAAAKKERIGNLVLSAQKEGRIVAAAVPLWTKRLDLDFENESAALAAIEVRPTISTGPVSAKFAARVTAGDDNLPDFRAMSDEERTYWLNRTLTLSASKNLPARDALRAALRGEGQEEYDAIIHARETETKYRGCGFRQQAVTLSADFDWDKVKYARERLKEGNGTGTAISDEFRHRVNVRFATIGGLTPGAATTLPASIGYGEPNYAAPDVLEEYVGGADMHANIFTFAQERFYIKVDPITGKPIATAPTADPNDTDFGVTPSTVTLEQFSDRIKVDRMLQSAAIHLPEGLMGIASEHIQEMVKVRREVAAAGFLRTYTNYAAANYSSLSGTQPWDLDTGLPITDITNGMLLVDGVVGQMPDTSVCSPKVFTGLRRNKQILESVKFTGTLSKPGTLVPIETLVALFGMKFLVSNARHTTIPGGTPAYTWGQDFAMVVTGSGKLKAPRFGYMVTAAGYPLTQTFPMQWQGPAGSDAIQVADAFAIQAGLNAAGFVFLGATALP
jgi:hypothetical protein